MAASTQTIQKMYIAYFGRPADTIGLQYWADKTEAQIIAGFSASSESQALFGNQGSAAKVNAIYNNLFARDAEPAGLQYWVQKLNSGEVSQAEAMYTILNNAGAGDATAVANKLAAAEAFTAQIDTTPEILGYTGANAAQSAREWLGKVNANAASLDAAKASAPAALAAAAGASAGDSGKTFTLTAGADAIVGTSGNDTINALSINAAGTAADTLTAFDSIDGGAGNDTLNIYTTAAQNAVLPANTTVKNVETINIYNSAAAAALADASKFVGATAINQIGVNAADVTNLAAGTTAGFNGTTQAALAVQAAAAATSATVALTGVAEATTLAVTAAASGVLNTVNVSGTRVDATPTTPILDLDLTVTAGKDVESVSINTSVNSALTVGNEALSTKALSTVDASASTGAIRYNVNALATAVDGTAAAQDAVAVLKTGAGNDVVGLSTALSTTVKAASVSTGAGDDRIFVAADATAAVAGSTVAVDAGEGNDTINLTIAAGTNVTYNVAAGAGNDTVVIAGTVKTTDKIDGGVGTDTVSLSLAAPKTLVADDYIVFNKVLSNFETLKLTTSAATMDASQLAATYNTIDLATGSEVTKVGSQTLIANGDLTATAAGYDAAATPKVYGGNLTITDKATGTVTANASNVALTVDASANGATVALAGDAQSANVTLVQALNTAKDAYVGAAAFTLDASGTVDANLSSVVVSGNGTATIDNAATAKLVSVDASGLNSVTFDGKAANGLAYTSSNALAETIKLGAGIDVVKLGASTYGKVDIVSGLNLVATAADAKVVDTTKSDLLKLGAAVTTFKAFTTTQTDLDLALKDAAASALGNDLVFHMGGNTYVYQDKGTDSIVDANDTVVQVVGQVNLDLLISSLAVA